MIKRWVEKKWPINVHVCTLYKVRPEVCIFHFISLGGKDMVTMRKENKGKRKKGKEEGNEEKGEGEKKEKI